MNPRRRIFQIIATFAVGALVAACGPETSGPADAKPYLVPEMMVTPVKGQFLAGCQTEELLNELLMHSAQRERTKFEAMFSSRDCYQIPDGGTFKILAVRQAVVEFIPAASKQSTGMWAPIEAFRPAQ